jgi:hypothetical protein
MLNLKDWIASHCCAPDSMGQLDFVEVDFVEVDSLGS